MDSRLADVLAQTDRAALGGRLRSARQARGLTQGEVADDVMSVAYLSRIESGHRQPTAPALETLAERLDVSVESLLGVAERGEIDEMRLALDYAELSLESGQPEDAEEHLRKALQLLEITQMDGLRVRARLLHARALEATKREDDAVLELESLLADPVTDGMTRIKAGIALSRIFRETGDLGRAIECGERVMSHIEDAGLGATDEAVQLAVTVAAAHFERGDTAHAVRLCRKAIARAETLGSPKARASAYWNASVMQGRRGDVGGGRTARRARARADGRGTGLPQPRAAAHRSGQAPARARPARPLGRAREPRAGGYRHEVEQRELCRRGVHTAGAGPSGVPRW